MQSCAACETAQCKWDQRHNQCVLKQGEWDWLRCELEAFESIDVTNGTAQTTKHRPLVMRSSAPTCQAVQSAESTIRARGASLLEPVSTTMPATSIFLIMNARSLLQPVQVTRYYKSLHPKLFSGKLLNLIR